MSMYRSLKSVRPCYPYYCMGLEFSKYSEEINLSASRKMGISATEQLDII